jgi:DNA repair photolyase
LGCTHGCLYCYARFIGEYANHPEPWGTYVDIKDYPNYDIPTHTGDKSLFFSSVTDAYQPIEASAKRTRMILEQIYESRLQMRFLTKSALIVRDLDLFTQMQSVEIGFSIALNDTDAKIVEPGASLPSARIEALKTLHAAGLKTFVFIAPIFPYLTDVFALIDQVKDACDYIMFDTLNLKHAENRANIFKFILHHHPDLLSRYRGIFESDDGSYYDDLANQIRKYANNHRLDLRIVFPERRGMR